MLFTSFGKMSLMLQAKYNASKNRRVHGKIVLCHINRHYTLCDSCSGQNKNYQLFKFLHYIIHHCSKLESVQITYPIRGHSYMECDKNMSLLHEKFSRRLIYTYSARFKPAPFHVKQVDQYYYYYRNVRNNI